VRRVWRIQRHLQAGDNELLRPEVKTIIRAMAIDLVKKAWRELVACVANSQAGAEDLALEQTSGEARNFRDDPLPKAKEYYEVRRVVWNGQRYSVDRS
jgi:hypothetical protein